MFTVVVKKDGSNEVPAVKSEIVGENVTTTTFDHTVVLVEGDHLKIYDDPSDEQLVKDFIPESRRKALRRFMEDGDGAKDFLQWLNRNGVARYLCEKHLRSGNLATMIAKAFD